jgi:hypothetical protein
MITDFFIANKNEALLINDYSDIKQFPLLQAKKVESVKLLSLEEFIIGKKLDISDILEPIKELDSQDAWIVPISRNIIEQLAKINSLDLAQVALNWSKTDEWILDGGTYENLFEFLKSLQTLSLLALQENKEMFVLISL